jgi:uncharacterized DUF497 family protein
MNYDWDEAKNAVNIRRHRIDFNEVERFEWETALVRTDHREDYGELRETAIGFIGDVVHVLVFTERGDAIRVISLRKATKRERMHYVQEAYER